MYKLIITCIALQLTISAISQQPLIQKTSILYGAITKDSLLQAPYSAWFLPNYNKYKIQENTIEDFKKISFKNLEISIFFGTWCGDSKREVPRFLQLLNSIKFPENQIHLFALGDDSLHKQSPQHQEAGLGIFKVPAFIIYNNGTELNRINEFPVYTLEQDLYTILSRQPYKPNYASFATIHQWLQQNVLLNENISTKGLAGQLKNLVINENELNSVGYLLLQQHKAKEALKIFQINYFLYKDSANIVSSLGEGYLKNGDATNAIIYLEHALTLNKDPQAIKGILQLLYQAKGLVNK